MTNNTMNTELNYYDYKEAVEADIINYIDENVNLSDYANIDEAYDALHDEMWIVDSITGNGSGSYWFSSWKAEKALCGNFDLMVEAYQDFGYNSIDLDGLYAETVDVTIRCYLLSEVLQNVLDNLYVEMEAA